MSRAVQIPVSCTWPFTAPLNEQPLPNRTRTFAHLLGTPHRPSHTMTWDPSRRILGGRSKGNSATFWRRNTSGCKFSRYHSSLGVLTRSNLKQFRYATLEHTRINTYAHLYTWNPPSSVFNPALKPIVLMAHQDVVPVNPTTESEWDQAPFGGVIDTEGGWVWGRGAADCKNQVSQPDY